MIERTEVFPSANWNLVLVGVGATDPMAIGPVSNDVYQELTEKFDPATIN